MATTTKANWGDGPWQTEPDHEMWYDEATGLPCIAHRHPSAGHWCGYVGVYPGHPLHGRDYDQCPRGGCEDTYCDHSASSVLDGAHGGLTYAKGCEGAVCHVPREGESHDVWWFGFDCAHSGDLSPGHLRYGGPSDHETYKTLDYVKRCCADLAASLTTVTPEPADG